MANRYDVHVQILPAEQQVSSRVFGFGYVSAVGIRGPQKLINRWLKCLMTPQGSDPFDPAYGTGFANFIGANIHNINDVLDAAVLFVQECTAQIRALDKVNFPPLDERLQTATIQKIVNLGVDGFEIWVAITNAAGVTTPVVLPSTSIRQ
jgi:hypothetical protein